MSASTLSQEQQIAELVDEVVFQQKRVTGLESCLEALLSYLLLLEQHILLPAFGNLTELLHEFHVVADARGRGETLLAATINANNQPQLARLFNNMTKPASSTLRDAHKHQLLSGPTPLSVDDTFAAFVAAYRQKDEMLSLLHRAHEAAASSIGHADPQQRQMLESQSRQIEELRTSLQAATAEAAAASQKCRSLEEQVAKNEKDRTAVAQSFDVLQKALEAAAAQSAAAQPTSIRDLVEAHRAEVDELNRKHHKVVSDLRKKLLHVTQSTQSHHSVFSTLGVIAAEDEIFKKELLHSMPSESHKAKLKAFEMTVAALNAELGQLEEKIIAMEAKYRDDIQSMQCKFDAERERFEREQTECDSVLANVSAELEQCMKENNDLRMRLQLQYSKLRT